MVGLAHEYIHQHLHGIQVESYGVDEFMGTKVYHIDINADSASRKRENLDLS
jgi:hypothetical protein